MSEFEKLHYITIKFFPAFNNKRLNIDQRKSYIFVCFLLFGRGGGVLPDQFCIGINHKMQSVFTPSFIAIDGVEFQTAILILAKW